MLVFDDNQLIESGRSSYTIAKKQEEIARLLGVNLRSFRRRFTHAVSY
jgi:hypothetical protein